MSATSTPPTSADELAARLGAAHAEHRGVRLTGAGTKAGWSLPVGEVPEEALSTLGLTHGLEHRPHDRLVRVPAGVSLARLQTELAAAGQMLALDPPHGETATIGGILAAGDSGPLMHRHGDGARLVRGLELVLADGTALRTGAAVRRRPGGPDLTPLFLGSHGSLGVIVAATLALIPRPEHTATAMGVLADPAQLADAVRELTHAGLELDALDVAWRRGRGGLLARLSGPRARRHASRAAQIMAQAGLAHTDVTEQDAELWERQRAGQRSADRALVRLRGAAPGELPGWLELADSCAATVIGRAARGVAYLELDPARVGELRLGLGVDTQADLLDRPVTEPLATGADPETLDPRPERTIAARFKARLDPHGVLNPHLAP